MKAEPDLTAHIPGKPRGQGSLTLWRGPDGKERAKHAPETVAHRNLMVGTLRDAWAGREPLNGPVAVQIVAHMPRPKAHWGTGRNARTLKPSAPHWATGYPDLDKIARLTGDALTIAGVIADDAQIVLLRSEKRYTHAAPGTTVEVFAL